MEIGKFSKCEVYVWSEKLEMVSKKYEARI